MTQTPLHVQQFFDSLSSDYTDAIERCFPRYCEMLWAVLEYLPAERNFPTILDLGCGTGNLSVLTHQRFPHTAMTVVDLSEKSLHECQSRLAACHNLSCIHADFSQLDFPAASFDLIVSSIAIHHLPAPDKRRLFQKIAEWLAPHGILSFADQCAGGTHDIQNQHMAHWKALSSSAGSSPEAWEMWMQHQRDCDHHDTMTDQMQWLRQAGFSMVDSPWRYLLWTVIQARK